MMLSPAPSVTSFTTEKSSKGHDSCVELDDHERIDNVSQRKSTKRRRTDNDAFIDGNGDSWNADSQRALRTETQLPARFRQSEELTLNAITQQAAQTSAVQKATNTRRTSLSKHNSTVPARGRLNNKRTFAATATKKPRRSLSPAAFPSLEPGTLPPSKEATRVLKLTKWAEQDDSWGRWGESWDEVGPYADEREVGRAVEARAKRACYWDKMTAAQWYFQEMLEQNERPRGQMHWTRRANVIHVLRNTWRELAVDVFGEDANALERKMMGIYRNFWQ